MPTPHATPSARVVLWEQFRSVGLAVRKEALFGAAFVVGATLLMALLLRGSGELEREAITPVPGLCLLLAWVGLAFPMIVWKGERRFGPSHLWTLPVNHARHAMAKVVAGWGWLMIVVAAALAWLLVVGLIVQADLGPPEIRWVLTDAAGTATGTGPARTREVAWVTPLWSWIVPFGAATFVYLISSSLVLATDHPLRWLAVIFLSLVILLLMGELGGVSWVETAFHRVESVLSGPYGLDRVLTGGHGSLTTDRALPSGEVVDVWRSLPHPGTWGIATLLWTALAWVGLSASAYRHRER